MHIFSIKRYSLVIVLLTVLVGVFVFNFSVLATANHSSIKIVTQPSSTDSVDSVLSQQPVLLVTDSSNNPVSGVTVTAVTNGQGNLSGSLSEVTDSSGLATFTDLSYSGTDSFQITFASSVGKAVSGSMELSPGAASESNSSISISPASVVADGQSLATIKIQCEDQYGNIIPGAKVNVSSSGSNNIFSQPGSADDPGIVTVNLSSITAESKIISATVNGVSIGSSSPVNFVPGKIAKLSISVDSPVDTNHKSAITITGEDESGNIVSNDSSTQVVLSVDNGGSLSSALITLADGVASSSLSKSVHGTVNLTASAGTINAQTQIVFTSSDETTPVVLSQYPLSGAQDVPVDVVPYIDFSKTMDVTTLTTDNVELKSFTDNSVVSVEVLVANGGKRVILQPSSNLNTNTKYYLYVNAGVSDASGNNLTSDYTGDAFTTAKNAQLSSSGQEQNIIQSVNGASSGTGTSVTQNNSGQATQNVSGNQSTNSTQNDASGSSSSSSSPSTSGGSITLTSGVSTKAVTAQNKNSSNNIDAIASYAQAGLVGAFKDFNFNQFGDWFMSNFIWVISLVVVVVAAYIFWSIYKK